MITKETKIWKYFSNLFVSIDQLGNTIAGGHTDNTISARVGYYNHYFKFKSGKVPWHWAAFEWIIDMTFYPADGPNHCHEAYHNDAGEVFDNRITNFLIAIAAAIIIIPSCVLITAILYPLAELGLIKQRTINREKNLLKRFDSCLQILKSTDQEIKEYGIDFDLTAPKKRLHTILQLANDIKNILDSKP